MAVTNIKRVISSCRFNYEDHARAAAPFELKCPTFMAPQKKSLEKPPGNCEGNGQVFIVTERNARPCGFPALLHTQSGARLFTMMTALV